MKIKILNLGLILGTILSACSSGPQSKDGVTVLSSGPDVPEEPEVLISDKYLKTNFKEEYANFEKEICEGETQASCKTKYHSMVKAKIKKNYRLANWEQVKLECEAEPVKCKTPSGHEEVIRDSHIEAAEKIYAERQRLKQAEEDAAEAEKSRQIANVFNKLGEDQKEQDRMNESKRAKCRSKRQWDGSVVTNCN